MSRDRAAPAPLAVTLGEPSGVGADIVLMLKASGERALPPLFVLADPAMLQARAQRLGLRADFTLIASPGEAADVRGDSLAVLALAHRQDEAPGTPNPANGAGTIEAIDRASAFALAGEASAVVTGPIDKKALYDVGFRHPGHTEYLAELCSRHAGEAADTGDAADRTGSLLRPGDDPYSPVRGSEAADDRADRRNLPDHRQRLSQPARHRQSPPRRLRTEPACRRKRRDRSRGRERSSARRSRSCARRGLPPSARFPATRCSTPKPVPATTSPSACIMIRR